MPFLIIAAFLPPNRHGIRSVHVWFTISPKTELIRSYCKSGWNSFVYRIPFHSSQFFQQAWMIHVFRSNFLTFFPLNMLLLECTLHINMHKNRTKPGIKQTHKATLSQWYKHSHKIHKKHHTVRWPSHIIWLLYYIFPCDNRLWIYHCENKNTSKATHIHCTPLVNI